MSQKKLKLMYETLLILNAKTAHKSKRKQNMEQT